MQNMKPLIMANSLHGFEIHAEDGVVGPIEDFYFNDQTWKISHVVANVGDWLWDRKVLFDPELLGHADWRKKFIEASATKEKIINSPDYKTALPVALQIEKQVYQPLIAMATVPEAYWGMHQYIEPLTTDRNGNPDPHLQSARIIKDSTLISEDGKGFGRLLDFLIDTETWDIRFLLLKTNDSRVFLAQPGIVKSIDVSRKTISVIHPEEEKKEWMEYDPHYMALLEIAQR